MHRKYHAPWSPGALVKSNPPSSCWGVVFFFGHLVQAQDILIFVISLDSCQYHHFGKGGIQTGVVSTCLDLSLQLYRLCCMDSDLSRWGGSQRFLLKDLNAHDGLCWGLQEICVGRWRRCIPCTWRADWGLAPWILEVPISGRYIYIYIIYITAIKNCIPVSGFWDAKSISKVCIYPHKERSLEFRRLKIQKAGRKSNYELVRGGRISGLH